MNTNKYVLRIQSQRLSIQIKLWTILIYVMQNVIKYKKLYNYKFLAIFSYMNNIYIIQINLDFQLTFIYPIDVVTKYSDEKRSQLGNVILFFNLMFITVERVFLFCDRDRPVTFQTTPVTRLTMCSKPFDCLTRP